MPHLKFEINKKVSDDIKKEFILKIEDAFSEVMDTDKGHIAISINEVGKYDISIGRAVDGDDICLMSLDIRHGRTIEQRRELALRFMAIVNELFKVDNRNQYLTYTKHDGEDFHLIERYLPSWTLNEDFLA
ncbi:tautomerase family protein [Malaciobacter marinus]|uniref:Tautomerase n=1 Tax=Malaciobacter marinus TaxID=505249 RepID=A0A347THK2_9BACT|nr:tautomerase [Malaciobacter marinus]AXX86080.1 hypothetical protein AMRN_0310 [Malaciobacter marinus]PHO11720.1 tautomerase [Malaciobacter marinus]PHO14335.1 tautomerase [Malaciobacter marinus]